MGDHAHLILIRCITAVYLSHAVNEYQDKTHRMVSDVLEHLYMPTASLGEYSSAQVAKNLRATLDWMLIQDNSVVFDADDLLIRIRRDVKEDTSLVADVKMALEGTDNEVRCRRRIQNIMSELSFGLREERVRRALQSASRAFNKGDGPIDIDTLLKETMNELEAHRTVEDSGNKKGFVGRITTDTPEEMTEVFKRSQENLTEEGMLRTGLVGLNRALGGYGLGRGWLCNFSALTNHYKSGILLDLSRHIPLYNDPNLWDEKKIPMVLRISFENKPEMDMPIIYRALIEQETGEAINESEIDPRQASEYVIKRLEDRGYKFALECYDPNHFSPYDLLDILQDYEERGYEIHLAVIDYLELIANRGGKDRLDESINEAFQLVRNHCYHRGITVCTGHQLSTQALEMSRESPVNFASIICNGGYHRNTKSLTTKLDLDVTMYIVKHGESKYLTFARGKHRGGERTPMKYLNFAYKFQPVGGICDDINKDVPDVIYDLPRHLNSTDVDDFNDSITDAPTEEAW